MKLKNNSILVFLKGMAMGMADLVPGVSGGTIALITGIYKELLHSINSITIENIKTIPQKGLLPFFKAINAPFLLAVFGGILTSIFCFSFLLEWLILHEPIALWSFFFGLLLSSIVFLFKQIKPLDTQTMLLAFGGAILAFYFSKLTGSYTNSSYGYLFFSGFIGISAMILPGLSGAYILLVLGVYELILTTLRQALGLLSNFDQTLFIETFSTLFVFGLGVLVGLRTFAGFLSWLFKKYPKNTLATLIGLMIGALHKVWPWQNTLVDGVASNADMTVAVFPLDYAGEPEILKAVILILLGFLILQLMERIKLQKDG